MLKQDTCSPTPRYVIHRKQETHENLNTSTLEPQSPKQHTLTADCHVVLKREKICNGVFVNTISGYNKEIIYVFVITISEDTGDLAYTRESLICYSKLEWKSQIPVMSYPNLPEIFDMHLNSLLDPLKAGNLIVSALGESFGALIKQSSHQRGCFGHRSALPKLSLPHCYCFGHEE